MKAISLLQPWASFWVLGIKVIETRSWSTKHRGKLMVHASLGKQGRDTFDELLPWLPGQLSELLPSSFDDLPFGGIIGEVDIAHCIKMTSEFVASQSDVERAVGDWKVGRYAFVAEAGTAFKEVIPCNGSLSIWTVPLEIEKLCLLH
jgi:hypothetical protein